MMVSMVRGRFDTFEAQIVTAEDPLQSAATATVDMNSVSTGNQTRDNDLRPGNFFAAGTNPGHDLPVHRHRRDGEDFVIDGELTLSTRCKRARARQSWSRRPSDRTILPRRWHANHCPEAARGPAELAEPCRCRQITACVPPETAVRSR